MYILLISHMKSIKNKRLIHLPSSSQLLSEHNNYIFVNHHYGRITFATVAIACRVKFVPQKISLSRFIIFHLMLKDYNILILMISHNNNLQGNYIE